MADLVRRVRGKQLTKAELLEVDRQAMLPIPAASSRPAGWSPPGRTRCPWCASTATTTRSRPPSPITSSPWSVASSRSASSAAPGSLRPIPGAGRPSGPPSIPPLPGASGAKARSPRRGPALAGLGPAGMLRPLSPAAGVGSGVVGHPGVHQGVLERASAAELAGAVQAALAIGATSWDAIALIFHHRQERPVSLFSLDGHPYLRPYQIDPPDLRAYAGLKGASA